MDEFEKLKLEVLDDLIDLYIEFIPYMNGRQMEHLLDDTEAIKTCTKESCNKIYDDFIRNSNILNYFYLLNQGIINFVGNIDSIDNKKILPEEKRIIRDKCYKIIMSCDIYESKKSYEELKDYINSLGKINLTTKDFDKKIKRILKRVKKFG